MQNDVKGKGKERSSEDVFRLPLEVDLTKEIMGESQLMSIRKQINAYKYLSVQSHIPESICLDLMGERGADRKATLLQQAQRQFRAGQAVYRTAQDTLEYQVKTDQQIIDCCL